MSGEQTPVREPTVRLTIDGITTDVPEGTLVIRAAEQIGIEIPRFCDHPLLKPAGACRQCLVEVALPGPDGELRQMQGPPGRMKPQPACTLVATEGMDVRTQLTSPGADKAQRGVMELLLINHPLDCPVCDKGGECPLQNQAMTNGWAHSRFAGQGMVKRTFPKPIALSPQILLDRERCILCQRCTRFADEVAGDRFIELVDRGAQQQVGIGPDAPFLSYFAGNTVQICPVGALTSVDYRFRARPFDLVSVASVAEHDACGAAIRVDHRRGKVMRRLSGDDPEVNQEWITDKDRYAFTYTRASRRITHPWIREDGELRPASWLEAFAVAGRRLRVAADSAGVGVLTGGRMAVEDAYVWSKFARVALGTNDVDFRARPHGARQEEEFLAEHVAGRRVGDPGSVTYADLEAASTVLLVGLEPEDEAGTLFLRLRTAVRDHGTEVVTLAPCTSRGSAKLGARVVRTAPGDEALVLRGQEPALAALDPSSVVLVGERLAGVPGGLAAAAELAAATGARLAWVPRRAGDRGAVEAGLLPGLLPGGRRVDDPDARGEVEASWGTAISEARGRDWDEMVAAVRSGWLSALVVGGVDPDDTGNPEGFRAALEAAGFVLSLELTWSDVARAADVVLPVSPVTERPGAFLTWDGRVREFAAVLDVPGSLPEATILAEVAREAGRPLGAHELDAVRRELDLLTRRPRTPHAALGTPGAAATSESDVPASVPSGSGFRLATWRQLIDHASLLRDETSLLATMRTPVVGLAAEVAAALEVTPGELVAVSGNRGTWELPVAVLDLPRDTVWVPTRSHGRGVWAELASPGSRVRLRRASAPAGSGAGTGQGAGQEVLG